MSDNTPLDHFLAGLKLSQYVPLLKKQCVDLDILELMDPEDLVNFGVKDACHVEKIRAAAKDTAYCASCREGFSAESFNGEGFSTQPDADRNRAGSQPGVSQPSDAYRLVESEGDESSCCCRCRFF
jgi:hypothetical protein